MTVEKHLAAFVLGSAAVWVMIVLLYLVVKAGFGIALLVLLSMGAGYCFARGYMVFRGID